MQFLFLGSFLGGGLKCFLVHCPVLRKLEMLSDGVQKNDECCVDNLLVNGFWECLIWRPSRRIR